MVKNTFLSIQIENSQICKSVVFCQFCRLNEWVNQSTAYRCARSPSSSFWWFVNNSQDSRGSLIWSWNGSSSDMCCILLALFSVKSVWDSDKCVEAMFFISGTWATCWIGQILKNDLLLLVCTDLNLLLEELFFFCCCLSLYLICIGGFFQWNE